MTSRFTELAIDCADPKMLAEFWCRVLEYQVLEEDWDTVTIGPAEVIKEKRSGSLPPVLTFARVPESEIVKNRLHLDLNPTDRDQDAEVQRLLSLGARLADVGQGEHSWTVLTDPAGNEFCVLSTQLGPE